MRVVLCLLLLLFVGMVRAKKERKIEVKIGVVLDDDEIGKVCLSCMNKSLSEFYGYGGLHYKTRLLLNYRNSKSDAVGTFAAAMDLIRNVEVQAILGPAKSTQAHFVIKLGEKAKVPIISFSASSPALTSSPTPYFFQATQSDKTQADALSSAIEAFEFTKVVPIYIDNEYGAGVIPYLCNALEAVDVHVPYRSSISPATTDDQILDELYKLKMLKIKVFIVHMYPSLGIRLFNRAKQVGMTSEGYVWILTAGMTTNFLDSSPHFSIFDSMSSVVLGVKPYIPKTKELEKFGDRWKKKFREENLDMADAELNVYGLWAYDAITALAIAIEKTANGTVSFSFQKTKVCSNPSTDLEAIGVSENGPALAQALSDTNFKGLTGDVTFVNQQLQPSSFQIDKINGARLKGTVIWTPMKGFSKKLNSLTSMIESNQPKYTCVPKDAELESDSWLRIGVPVKKGFCEFVNVTTNAASRHINVSGFCIDVFDTVMKRLGNHLPYCYIPFYKPDNSAGYYDELVNQVFLGKYDGVVGDVSIIASRASHVDYTMPYMEYGPLQMIVPYNKTDLSWVLFKPLTPNLWVACVCFFVFTGFVVWILEHGQNQEFQGSISSQFGVSFWFAFSIMIFAHRERISNNLTRGVVLMSCFVVLLLTQSYGAALSSYLTIQQLQPDVDDVKALIAMDVVVGYQGGSFVYGILRNWGFKQQNLKPYTSAHECSHLLLKGAKNGGIAAAFDEPPFINLILKHDRNHYGMVQPKLNDYVFQPAGFGFVFRRGSPLATEASRQILSLIENNTIKEYQETWLGNEKDDSVDNSSKNGPDRLGIDSFWVLFLIAGIVSGSALLIHGVQCAYKCKTSESKNVGVDSDDSVSVTAPPSSSTPPPDHSIHGNQPTPSSPDHQTPNGQTPHVELTTVNQQQPPCAEITHQTNG